MPLTRLRSAGVDYEASTFVDATNSGSVTLNFANNSNFILTFIMGSRKLLN